MLGLLPYAARTARVLSDGGDITDRRFIRSELMRTARSAADEVQRLVRRRRQRLAPSAAPAQVGPAPVPDGEGAAPGYPSAPQSYGPVPQAPVITTGPVAPLAGLAPQPAAPAPFPAHVQPPRQGPSPRSDAPGAHGGAEQYGQQQYGQQQYGGAEQYGQAPHGQPQFGAAEPYGQQPYGQASYGPQSSQQPQPQPQPQSQPQPPQPQPPLAQGPQHPSAGPESHVSYGEVLRAR